MNEYINVTYSSNTDQYITKRVYQYDRGRKMRIFGIPSTAAIQVQYSVHGMQTALVDLAEFTDSAWTARVPNVLLTQNRAIQAYVYISFENGGTTIMHVTIPIEERAKPEDYVFTEDELRGLEYVVRQLSEAVQTVESLNEVTIEAAENANQAADSVYESIELASQAAQNANEQAQSANTAASNASDAAESATQNATAAAEATTAANQAASSASEAAQKANEAAERVPTIDNEGETIHLLEQSDIDSTLSIEGKVADAAAVGRKITEISNIVNEEMQEAFEQIKNDVAKHNLGVADVVQTEKGLRVDYHNGTSNEIELEAGLPIDAVVYDEEHYLHFYDVDGEDLFDPVFIEGGGGGTSTVGAVSITRITNAAVDCIYGDSMPIQYRFSAADSSGDIVGDGVGAWSIGGIVVASNVVVRQGDNTFDISPYLTAGINNVKLSVSVDTGGESLQTATKTWTVNAVNMYFTWPYDDAQNNTSAFTDSWTVYGDISKTTHTVLDGTELETLVTSRTNATQTMVIPKLSHGAHSLERWLTALIGTTEQSTAHQYHEIIFTESGNTTPVIAISMKNQNMKQYDTLQVPVVVIDPSNLQADAILSVNGEQIGAWNDIDRSLRYWTYTPTTAGEHVLTVSCGDVSKSITITAEAVDIDVEEVSGYSFRFKASDLATNSAVQNWNSNGVNATFSDDFDWINGGLHTETDTNGALQQYLCVKAGTQMTINHKLFAIDPKSSGMTFKMILKIKNCRDYDAQIAHCYADNVGIRMYAHKAIFNSSGMSVNVPYGENEYIELEFDVYPAPRQDNDGNYRYMMAWMDGVITSCRVYGANDNFVQSVLNQEGIVIGSEDCDVYVYMVKAYPMLMSRDNHINNFIADAPNSSEMVRRYNRNNILDESGQISYEKLMAQNPNCRIWLYDIPYMTTGKKDKVKNCKFNQFYPSGGKSYELTGEGTMTVQGTSSVKYIEGAANTDINFTSIVDGYGNNLMANGIQDETEAYGNNWYLEDAENPGTIKVFTAAEGEELGPECIAVERDENRKITKYIKALGYKINDDSTPITYSNTKVNFASCEQVNNMCNAAWYQRFNPYQSLTPRDSMEFAMGVQFIKDSGTVPDDSHFVLWGDNKYHMYSIGNMGTSKKNVHVFHDMSNPKEVCIEVNDNDKDQMRMVSDDLSAEDWSGDVYFGMRYPDTKDPSQEIRDAWQRLVTWMANSNPNGFTGAKLAKAETYGNYTFKGHDREGTQVLRGTTVTQYAGTYEYDTFERRMAKMLSECEDYMVMDSFMYHFVYLERHTMVDNVSKNNFWSSTDLLHWDLSKAYDMDTSDGNNNQGQMVFDYGNEYNDDIGDMKVFNGADSVWFVFCANLYEACQTMFTNREAAGAWSASAYHNFMLSEQQKVPERCWVECYWYDYLRTYEQGISAEWMTFLDGGQKTHQRKHYEFFQELYDSSKYRGTTSTSQNVNFRAYTPATWAGVEPKGEMTLTMYNKMYISMDVGTTQLAPIKAERGIPVTIDFSDGGTLNNTLIAVNTASMIQAISGMEQLYPDTCVFSAASRLRELTIGSDAEGYENTFLKTLALDNNTMLEYLYVQNLPNAASVLDLTKCPSLLYVNASGSGFTGYEFADGGLLTTAILHKPTSLSIRNLAYLTDEHFSIADYSALATLRHENTPGVDSMTLVNAAAALQIVRLIGIDWVMANTNLLDRMYLLQGLDESNYTITRSVLAGNAYVPVMRQINLDRYNAAWPDLNVDYDSMTEQYAVRFYNADGTPVKDPYGNNYVQYIDRGSTAYDPVEAGDITAPTLPSDAQYRYTFSGWDNLTGAILGNRDVTAVYDTVLQTYTVRWYAQPGDLRKTLTDVSYGSEVKYSDDPYDFPALVDEEDAFVYKVFQNWDKSTGFITCDTDVYAIWDRSALPAAGDVELKDMSVAQIYGIAKNKAADDYWTSKDHIDIVVGKDFEFQNVESEVLAENLYLDGTAPVKTAIKLFDANTPDFTIAIDYEFTSTELDNTLVSCFVEDGSEGFRLRYTSAPNVQWGDKSLTIGYNMTRGIVVLRHRKGTNNLYVTSNNPGTGSYKNEILIGEMARTRSTETNAVLTFGGVPFGDDTFDFVSTGWIHWCKVWYADLGNTVVQQLASWPHETWRMEYIDAERYRLAGDTTEKCAASFISNAPLALPHCMNTENTNAGGWDASNMRIFTNGRCFDALPFSWQSIIQTVKISASAGTQSTEILTSEDKMYLPSYAEVSSVSTEPYASEGKLIPWFTSAARRLKFYGLMIPQDAQIITDQSEPTLLGELYPNIKEGDIWVNASYENRGYMYISAETIAKHGWIGGREVTSESNIAASDGGLWVYAAFWWERSPSASSDAYFMYVNTYGLAGSHTYASSAFGVDLGFSI